MTLNAFKNLLTDVRIHAIYISIIQNEKGDWIGYYLNRCYLLTYPEHSTVVSDKFAMFRGQSVLNSAYRGHLYHGTNISILASAIIYGNFKRNHPEINIMGFAPLIRPESLILLSKKGGNYSYPSPFYSTPKKVEEFMIYLRNYFGFVQEGSSVYAIKYPFVSRLSEKEKQAFQKSDAPLVKYFRDITGLKEGVAMVGLYFLHPVPNNSLDILLTERGVEVQSKI